MPWNFRSAIDWMLSLRSSTNVVDDISPMPDEVTLETDLDKEVLRKEFQRYLITQILRDLELAADGFQEAINFQVEHVSLPDVPLCTRCLVRKCRTKDEFNEQSWIERNGWCSTNYSNIFCGQNATPQRASRLHAPRCRQCSHLLSGSPMLPQLAAPLYSLQSPSALKLDTWARSAFSPRVRIVFLGGTDQPDASSTISSIRKSSSVMTETSMMTTLTDVTPTSSTPNTNASTPSSDVFPFLKMSSLRALSTVWETPPPRATVAVAAAAAVAAGATARNMAPSAVASLRAWKKVFKGQRNFRDLGFDDLLQAAESGNLNDFTRLWDEDPSRLSVQDGRGRTAAHQASARDQVPILKLIFEKGGGLNVTDKVGNTPLHVAIIEDALGAVEFLLSKGVNTSILNEKHQAAIHLATERNRVNVLKTMGRYPDRIDASLGGEHGRTALHLAAIYDHDECARVLVEHWSACAMKPCANGYYPIHEAAKNASSRTMEVILQWGESKGCYTREAMISLFDAEGNVPLHSAVHGGDIRAVELCLRSGARISTQQHDLSTPVHLACAQGAGDIVELMFNLQPAEKARCLRSCDAQRMTPMHCAAMFDHPDIVEFLRREGADIDPLDKEKRSPLLLAASRSAWRTVNVLIRLEADMYLADSNSRNVLHLLVMNGGRLDDLDEFTLAMTNKKLALEKLLNERDSTGCSPMHYASREGHIRSLENLIRLGACINLKNNNNESPLHFAARYGRYNTVRHLLDSEKGTFIINEGDGEGLTPLHIASQQGHTRIVQLLLNRGALLHRDHNGRTPLHLAAMSGYTQTMELLLSVHSHLLDQVDKDGNTALHLATMENKPNSISLLLSMNCQLLYNAKDMSAIDYAIYYKYPDSALAMVTHDERAQEVLEMKSDKCRCVTLALIASMPRVFESVQDKCIVKANCKKDSKSFYIKYNFGCLDRPMRALPDARPAEPRTGLMPSSKKDPLPALNIKYSFLHYEISADKLAARRRENANPKWRPPPLHVINAMVAHGRVELLAHPLSQKYLQMKWHSYGKYFHLANLIYYCIFLAFVTAFSTSLMEYLCVLESTENCSESDRNYSAHHNVTRQILHHSPTSGFNGSNFMYFCSVVILIYVASNALREIFQLYQQRLGYMADPSNIVTWMLYFFATATVLPLFCGHLEQFQISAASATVFLAWFNLLLFLQRFDRVGIYVVMFLEILQTLIKVLLIFSILIIAFGLAFYILLSRGNHLPFRSAPMSLIRTFSMMLGEIDVLGTFVQPYYRTSSESLSLPYPFPALVILVIFMIVMPILLMNLLIGLAVGDIESVRRNAQLKRLAMQVVLHTELERKLPHFLLDRVDRTELIEYPNDSKCRKLGFIDTFLRKWFCSPFNNDESSSDIPQETSDDFLAEELLKAKQRLKEMSASLESQHLLLRLIVQKMEIKTEADDVDEGAPSKPAGAVCRWKAPRLRNRLRAARAFKKTPSV